MTLVGKELDLSGFYPLRAVWLLQSHSAPEAPCLKSVGDVTIADLLRGQKVTSQVKDFKYKLVSHDVQVLISYEP